MAASPADATVESNAAKRTRHHDAVTGDLNKTFRHVENNANSTYQKDAIIINENSLCFYKRIDNVYKVNVETTNVENRISKYYVANLMLKLNVNNVFEMKMIGRQKMCIYFNDSTAANSFNKMNLKEYDLKTSIPLHYLTVTGVIKNIPNNIKLAEIMELAKYNDNVYKIERIYRTAKDDSGNMTLIPTNCIKVIFIGSQLPESFSMLYYKERVHPYIFKLRQCTNCWRYGHSHTKCKSKLKCNKCGEEHKEEVCISTITKCSHCNGNHKASDKECLERARRNNINIIMATKNLSFGEAIEQFPIYTTNGYNLLENLEDFPTLTATNYSKTLRKPKNSSNIGKKTFYATTSSKKEKTKNATAEFDRNKYNKYYNEQLKTWELNIEPIVDNPHKTTELEKLNSLLNKNENNNQLNKQKSLDKQKPLDKPILSPYNEFNTLQYNNEDLVNELFMDSSII
jgi:hypothetical protein